MMKRMLSMLLAVLMALALTCPVVAEEEDFESFPQPEGGKKFDTTWAVQNTVLKVDYEEAGYRVSIVSDEPEEGKGTEYSYNCFYAEDRDALVSTDSSKQTFTFDPADPDNRVYADAEYDDPDEEGQETVFTINEKGRLLWQDGRGNEGQDLEFVNIGRFAGAWKNAEGEETVYAEFTWDGHDDRFYYDVFLQRGDTGADTYAVFHLTGIYNEETRKLECTGTAEVHTKNEQGEDVMTEDGETHEAFFSLMENGSILFEAANGIELVPDFDNQG